MQNYWLVIPFTLVAVAMSFLFRILIMMIRKMTRIEGVLRSSLYSHVANTITGATVARAFGRTELLIQEFHDHLDRHSSALYLFICFNNWGCLTAFLTSVIYIACIIFVMISTRDASEVGNTGLALVGGIFFSEMVFWACYIFGHFECDMSAVERVTTFSKLPLEAPLESSEGREPSEDWPQNGEISFRNVSLSYSKDGPEVIKNINFQVQPKQKIGIVGSTGSGKTSIFRALLRLQEPKGKIIIDGIPIQDVGLHSLRSRISIIPQDPVLFCGTVRSNLDPLCEYSDETLWATLDKVQMSTVVKKLQGTLESRVSQGGANFSVGEKQLFCLARALLRGNKILLLDEATANIDSKTDDILQNVIRLHYQNCTVITIAHRLNTVMDSDRILVMEAGQMVEFDSPQQLLKTKMTHIIKSTN